MVIKIVTNVQVNDRYFLIGQEYSYVDSVTYDVTQSNFGGQGVRKRLGYLTIIDNIQYIIPAEDAALIKKDKPSTNMMGMHELHRVAATQDAVVFDGNYVKAIKDRFDIDITPYKRADQADYDSKYLKYANIKPIGTPTTIKPTDPEEPENPQIPTFSITFNTAGGSSIQTIRLQPGTIITKPANPTKTGYSFNSWIPPIPDVMPNNNITCTAQWVINTYIITFVGYDGTVLSQVNVNHGHNAIPPTNTDREGYQFIGWSSSNYINVTSNATITAQYTEIGVINTYTVTFKDHNGIVLKQEEVNEGESALPPSDPTRTGYTFTGWSSSFDSITEDKEIIAQYTINQYTITFDTDGGDAMPPITLNYGQAIAVDNEPVKDGYSFIEWVPALPDTMPANNIQVTAVWDQATYNVTFYDWDGIELKTEVVPRGQDATPPVTPTRENFVFAKWDGDYFDVITNVDVYAEYDVVRRYGRLYPFNETIRYFIDQQGVWKVPTESDFASLRDYLNNITSNSSNVLLKSRFQLGTPLGERFDTSDHPRWDLDASSYGLDEFNFGALPSGKKDSNNDYLNLGSKLILRTKTLSPNNNLAWVFEFSLINSSISRTTLQHIEYSSIRLCRDLQGVEDQLDDGTFVGLVEDYEGNKYATVKINDKVWFAQDLIATKDSFGYDVISYDYDEIDIPQNVKVTFVDSDFSFIKEETLPYEGWASPPDNPVQNNKVFVGWLNSYQSVSKSVTCVAKYIDYDNTKNIFRWLDFDGTVLFAEQVINGGSSYFNGEPKREGYSFIRWEGDSNTQINADGSRTAVYAINTEYPLIWNNFYNGSDTFHGYTILTEANPRINGIPIEDGDWIGAFYIDDQGEKKCAGAMSWRSFENNLLLIYGNNTDTPTKDGFSHGEIIELRFYSVQSEQETIVTDIEYDQTMPVHNGKWYNLGLSRVLDMYS